MLKKDSLKKKNLLSSCVVTNKELLGNPSLVVNAVAQIWYLVNLYKPVSSTSVTDMSTDTFFNTLGWTELGASL